MTTGTAKFRADMSSVLPMIRDLVEWRSRSGVEIDPVTIESLVVCDLVKGDDGISVLVYRPSERLCALIAATGAGTHGE